jgi:hypothetical protein
MNSAVLIQKSYVDTIARIWSGDIDVPDGIQWAIQQDEHLHSLRYEIGAPSLWYITWFGLLIRSTSTTTPCFRLHYNNPSVVWDVATFESKHVHPNRRSDSKVAEPKYLDAITVAAMLRRKPFAHDELHRAQQLHIALTITRPMYTASRELNIAHSSSQIQRKWMPDPWIAHLCSDVFKHLVNQLLILERWKKGFIQNTLLLPRDSQRTEIKRAIRTMSHNIIYLVSHTSAHIINSDTHSMWYGPITDVISAWISLSRDTTLRSHTQTQQL